MKQRIFSHFQDYLIQYISHQYQDLLYCNSSQYILPTYNSQHNNNNNVVLAMTMPIQWSGNPTFNVLHAHTSHSHSNIGLTILSCQVSIRHWISYVIILSLINVLQDPSYRLELAFCVFEKLPVMEMKIPRYM